MPPGKGQNPHFGLFPERLSKTRFPKAVIFNRWGQMDKGGVLWPDWHFLTDRGGTAAGGNDQPSDRFRIRATAKLPGLDYIDDRQEPASGRRGAGKPQILYRRGIFVSTRADLKNSKK